MHFGLYGIESEKLEERWYRLDRIDKTTEFSGALNFAIKKIRKNLKAFTYAFPSITAPNGIYGKIPNEPWTTGFWPGMVWIAYAMTKDKAFYETGKIQSILFKERVETNFSLRHHDIGFLYSLSAVADYKLTGDTLAYETAMEAAKCLTKMYQKTPGIIQRGGDINDLSDEFTGVFIIDCMNNVPLLFWAYEESGNRYFYDVAYNHMKNSVDSIVKKDGRVVQHGIANVLTGEIACDSSQSQGKGGDDAAWGRGQAWAISGLPIAYRYTKDPEFLNAAKAAIVYFLNRLPTDLVANWDLYYTSDDEQRDTSASSIAVCGMLELCKYLEEDDPYKQVFYNAALNILKSLTDNYLSDKKTMSILDSGVYGMNWKGVNEPNIWGDYYYTEALYRLLGDFISFW